jgi:hypothetical protein
MILHFQNGLYRPHGASTQQFYPRKKYVFQTNRVNAYEAYIHAWQNDSTPIQTR